MPWVWSPELLEDRRMDTHIHTHTQKEGQVRKRESWGEELERGNREKENMNVGQLLPRALPLI